MCGRVSLARIEAFCISFYHEIAIKKINYRFHTFVLLISPKREVEVWCTRRRRPQQPQLESGNTDLIAWLYCRG
jgi:hypothetical protein